MSSSISRSLVSNASVSLLSLGFTSSDIDSSKFLYVTPSSRLRYLSGDVPSPTFGHILLADETSILELADHEDVHFIAESVDSEVTFQLVGERFPGPEPVPGPVTPPGRLVNSFVKGDISRDAWNSKRLSYPLVNSTVYDTQEQYERRINGKVTTRNPRATRGGNSGLPGGVGHVGISGNGQRSGGDGSKGQLWRYGAGHEIPLMDSEGRLVCYRTRWQHDPHCMVLFCDHRSTGNGYRNVTSWIPKDLYTKRVRLTFPDSPSDYRVSWVVLDQLRGNGYTGPQLGLYLRNGVFTVRQLSKYKVLPLDLVEGKSYEFDWKIVLSEGGPVAPVTELRVGGDLVYESFLPNYAGTSSIENSVGYYGSYRSDCSVLIDSYELWHKSQGGAVASWLRVVSGCDQLSPEEASLLSRNILLPHFPELEED